MAMKHQLIAYNQHDPSVVRPVLQATHRSLRCSTTRMRNSFLPQTVRMLNAPASQIFSLDFIYYLFIYLLIIGTFVCLFEMYVWSWSVRNAFSFCCSINKMTINLIWFDFDLIWSIVDVAVLREEIQKALQDKFPTDMHIQIANNEVYIGIKYAVGMVLTNGSTGGLTDFGVNPNSCCEGHTSIHCEKLDCLVGWTSQELYPWENKHCESARAFRAVWHVPINTLCAWWKRHCIPETIHMCSIDSISF